MKEWLLKIIYGFIARHTPPDIIHNNLPQSYLSSAHFTAGVKNSKLYTDLEKKLEEYKGESEKETNLRRDAQGKVAQLEGQLEHQIRIAKEDKEKAEGLIGHLKERVREEGMAGFIIGLINPVKGKNFLVTDYRCRIRYIPNSLEGYLGYSISNLKDKDIIEIVKDDKDYRESVRNFFSAREEASEIVEIQDDKTKKAVAYDITKHVIYIRDIQDDKSHCAIVFYFDKIRLFGEARARKAEKRMQAELNKEEEARLKEEIEKIMEPTEDEKNRTDRKRQESSSV